MDVQQAVAPIAPKPSKPQSVDKNDGSKDELKPHGAKAQFAQMLQGLQGLSDAQSYADEMPAQEMLPGADGLTLAAHVEPSLASLVGQTQHLDGHSLDADLQDGSLLQQRQQAGLLSQASLGAQNGWGQGAKTAIAVGQQVATVAAGVQASNELQVPAAGQAASPAAAPSATALSSVMAGMEVAAQTVADGVKAEQPVEGRLALQGAWKLEDPQMALNPGMQRLMGQVEQWAAATAGMQSKNAVRAEPTKHAASGVQWLSSEAVSRNTLTDNAVQDVQQAQDAMLDTKADEPVQDMRFWLQGKQQRAQVVMDKDGHPVRVQVTLRGNAAQISFQTDQLQTREMLDASLEQLRSMLDAQGLELADVKVHAQTQDGAQQQQAKEPHSPWNAAPVQHAQVRIPGAQETVQSTLQPTKGVSFYA